MSVQPPNAGLREAAAMFALQQHGCCAAGTEPAKRKRTFLHVTVPRTPVTRCSAGNNQTVTKNGTRSAEGKERRHSAPITTNAAEQEP